MSWKQESGLELGSDALWQLIVSSVRYLPETQFPLT